MRVNGEVDWGVLLLVDELLGIRRLGNINNLKLTDRRGSLRVNGVEYD